MCKRTDQGHDYNVFDFDHYNEAFHDYDDVDDDDDIEKRVRERRLPWARRALVSPRAQPPTLNDDHPQHDLDDDHPQHDLDDDHIQYDLDDDHSPRC